MSTNPLAELAAQDNADVSAEVADAEAIGGDVVAAAEKPSAGNVVREAEALLPQFLDLARRLESALAQHHSAGALATAPSGDLTMQRPESAPTPTDGSDLSQPDGAMIQQETEAGPVAPAPGGATDTPAAPAVEHAPAGDANTDALAAATEAHPPTGGSAAPQAAYRWPVPAWCQLLDDNPAGARDVFASTDCGEQACAMVTFACHHVELPEQTIREYIHQHVPDMTDGRTTGAMLAWYLSSQHNNFPHAESVEQSASQLLTLTQDDLRAGHLVIALGEFYKGTEHWVVVRGFDNRNLIYNDPWDGQVKAIDNSTFVNNISRGVIVRTHGAAQYD